MSVYEKPWHVSANNCHSYWATPEEALEYVEARPNQDIWISKGYAEYRDVPGRPDITEVIRRGDETVSLEHLRALVEMRAATEALTEARRRYDAAEHALAALDAEKAAN